MTEIEINDIIKGKAEKYIGKWGNHSKVGVLLNRYDNEQKMRDEFEMKPRNQAPQDRRDSMMSPKATGKRMGSLPALDDRKAAVGVQRRTKSIN